MLHGPTMVMSGFSGSKLFGSGVGSGNATDPAEATRLFIDLNGPSVRFFAIDDFEAGFDGREIKRQPYRSLLAKDIGQVFGMAFDDAERPNLYLAATSAYGLPIVGRDQNGDGVPDKLYAGRSDAAFMAGLFGSVNDNGPGSIWKVDGATGQISRFASIKLDNMPNSGPALGNIVFDSKSRQLFVSDRDTGMIFRLDMEGHILESFDHGSIGRTVAGMRPIHFDTRNRLDITVPSFDVEDPSSWHFAKEGRRVWAVAVNKGRLYYSVAEGPSVWSVGIDADDGNFKLDARQELVLPDTRRQMEISDIAFGPDGSIILAQRGMMVGAYDFSRLARPRQAQVLRYKKTRDGSWRESPTAYAVGFAARKRNGTGGVALGPGYDDHGKLVRYRCSETLWTTGENLRNDPRLAEKLRQGGALRVSGAQAQSLLAISDETRPPWKSYFIDFDGQYPSTVETGHIGDVEIYGCAGMADLRKNPVEPEAAEPEPSSYIQLPGKPLRLSQTGLELSKEQVGDCRADRSSRSFRCEFRLTLTNKGDKRYSGPMVITDEFQRPHATEMALVGSRDWRCSQPMSNFLMCLHEAFTLDVGQSRSLTMRLRVPAQIRADQFHNCALLGYKSVFRQKVALAQLSLEAAGIRSGGVDGRVGPKTKRGLRLLQAQLGMKATGDMGDRVLTRLNLPQADANSASCSTTQLAAMPFSPRGQAPGASDPDDEPLVIPAQPDTKAACDGQTAVQRGNGCACRYDGMRKISPGRCDCRRGADFVAGQGCVFTDQRAQCDPATAERKGRSCFCRYPGMERISSRACRCPRGQKLVNGRGCIDKAPITPSPSRSPRCDRETALVYGGRCECRYPYMYKTSARACACNNPDAALIPGRGCVIPSEPLYGSSRRERSRETAPACDRTTTIRRGNRCVCLMPEMVQVSPTRCVLRPRGGFGVPFN
ncbi:peptidoglycan-binding domain-containing protein [Cohaesibacter sp. ES.047]|uniref:peptidoglycan-binding domain-containing protein n=1 Tax=Cohaesibacter sp. ES.047 TaxID=1798205 RepID=UPI0012FE66CF|nr:peptidoglycan-binding domain-containing protein [Cohaesibacter sp. ES.047]